MDPYGPIDSPSSVFPDGKIDQIIDSELLNVPGPVSSKAFWIFQLNFSRTICKHRNLRYQWRKKQHGTFKNLLRKMSFPLELTFKRGKLEAP